MTIDDGAIIVVVTVILSIESNSRSKWRSRAIEGNRADSKAVRQVQNSAQTQVVANIVLRRASIEFRQQRIKGSFAVEYSLARFIIAVPCQRVSRLELQVMAQAAVDGEIKSVIRGMRLRLID